MASRRFRIEWSQKHSDRKKSPAEALVYLSILIVGLLLLVLHLFYWGIPQWRESQEFVSGQCTVLDTKLSQRSENGQTFYRPEVQVRIPLTLEQGDYVLWTYEAATLSEDGGFTYEKEEAESILAQYEKGEKVPCWFHPKNPEGAVLVRKTSLWGWFFFVIPLCLIFPGIAGICRTMRIFSVSEERRAAQFARRSLMPFSVSEGGAYSKLFPSVPASDWINDSPGTTLAYRLPSVSIPSIRLAVLTVFTVFWNLVAWTILVWSLYQSSGSRTELLISALFGVTFCGFGLILAIGIIHSVLTAFGIGPTIMEISDHPLYPGRKYRLMVLQMGTLRYRWIKIELVCQEHARSRQGTDTITSNKEVYSQELFRKEDFETTPGEPFREELFIRLPIGAMHSIRSEHNEITWKIVLRAELIGWPELLCECPVIVNPVTITEQAIE